MDFTGKAPSPIADSANGRKWYLITADMPDEIRRSLAVEARNAMHARRRVERSLAAIGATLVGCFPMTRELWICVDATYPLPTRPDA